MKKFLTFTVAAAVIALLANEIDIGKPRAGTQGVETIQIDGKNAVRISSTAAMPDTLRLQRNFGLKLKPNTNYVISYEMRTNNITPRPTKGMKGAGMYLVSGGKLIYRGSHLGRWRHTTGTIPWTKFEYKFKTGNDGMSYLYFELAEATGSAEFAKLSVSEVLPAVAKADNSGKATADLAKPIYATGNHQLITVDGKPVLKCTAGGNVKNSYRRYQFSVIPGATYKLSCRFRGSDLKPMEGKSLKGAGLGISNGSKTLYRGSDLGKWKHRLGTFDWTPIELQLKMDKASTLIVTAEVADASGTAEFADLTLTPVASAPAAAAARTPDGNAVNTPLDFNRHVYASHQTEVTTVNGKQVLKCVTGAGVKNSYRRYTFKVLPKHQYTLTVYFRGKDLKPLDGKSLKGAGLGISSGNKTLYRGSDLGKWKHRLGTFDWTKIELPLTTVDNTLAVTTELADAAGTAEFTDFKLTQVGPAKAKPAASPAMPARKKYNVSGVVFKDLNANGQADAGEPGFSGVQVSDGRQIVITDANGKYHISNADGKFIFISKPADGVPTTATYCPAGTKADFGLKPVTPGKKAVFYSLNDSEGHNADAFIHEVKSIVSQMPGDFLVHCGDIGSIPGHKATMGAAGLPVYYAIGNHDFHKGASCGEELFEKNFGPVYYSFNYNGVHFITIAYLHGVDAPPTADLGIRQLEWLKKDIALNPGPKVIFRHHPMRFNDDAAKVVLNPANGVIATVSGHTHATSTRLFNGIVAIECAPPNKGAVDHTVKGIIRGVIENGKVQFKVINNWKFRSGPDADPQASPVNPGADWPQFRKDSGRSGASDHPLAMPLKLRWKTKTSGTILASSPIISNGKLFIATGDDAMAQNAAVCAYDLATGKLLWSTVVGASSRHTIAADNQRVYAALVDGHTVAIDRHNGKILWKTLIPYYPTCDGLFAPVLLHGNRLFIGGDHVTELDPASGRIIREDNKLRRGSPCHAGALIAGNRIYSSENWRYGIYAHDLSTGQQLWTTKRGPDGAYTFLDSGPAYANGKLYQRTRTGVRILDPENGNMVRQHTYSPLRKTMESYSLPLVSGKMVYCASAHGLFAHDAETLDLKWSFIPKPEFLSAIPYSKAPMPAIYSSPAIAPGALLFGGADGFFYVLDPVSGKELYSIDCGAPIYSSPALSGNTAAIAAVDGTVYVFTASQK